MLFADTACMVGYCGGKPMGAPPVQNVQSQVHSDMNITISVIYTQRDINFLHFAESNRKQGTFINTFYWCLARLG